MSTQLLHQRTKVGSVRRLALPAMTLLGLAFVGQLIGPFASPSGSIVRADGLATDPGTSSSTPRKVQPLVMDFTRRHKQKAEARRLLELAQRHATAGDLDAARRCAERANSIPVDWNLSEITPQKCLDMLVDDPEAFAALEISGSNGADAEAAVAPVRAPKVRDSEVIELPSPRLINDRDVVEVAPKKATAKPLGFKQSESQSQLADSISTSNIPSSRRRAPIPSLEELASDVEAASSKQPTEATSTASPNPVHAVTANSAKTSVAASLNGLSETNQRDNLEPTAHKLTSKEHSDRSSSITNEPATHPVDRTALAMRPLPSIGSTEVVPHTVREVHVIDRPVPAPVAANTTQNSDTQFVSNLNGLLTAGLFASLIVMVVCITLGVLRWFSSNAQITFKVEMNNPVGFPIQLNAAAPAVPAPAAPQPKEIVPVYALKRQMEEELETQREDAMMRQVFEDNLKLREQLDEEANLSFDENRIAA